MDDWAEIRRLAADLQRAQLTGAQQKLSERNCIEIVSKLIRLNILDVIFTNDGKQYLTPQHLAREIRDEVFLSRGLASLVDLSSSLTVDFSHVEASAQAIVRADGGLHLVLGQIVAEKYLDEMAQEINERLQQEGTVSISNITKEYDLPSEFLQEHVIKRLGSIIEGYQDQEDPKVILTPTHVARNRAKIRGALSAITVPTPVATIINKYAFQERLFFVLAGELIGVGRVQGTISGGKKASKATFIPHSYARAQIAWAENFFQHNSYLEYDALSRLGISSPLEFIRKRFVSSSSSDAVVCLSTCCVSGVIRDNVEASVDEALSAGAWVDAGPLLPSVCDADDAERLLRIVLADKSDGAAAAANGAQIFAKSVVVSRQMIDDVRAPFYDLIDKRAQAYVESGSYARTLAQEKASVYVSSNSKLELSSDKSSDKKDERRRKAAGGKGGGGTQGRETKTKSTKRKGGKRREETPDSGEEAAGDGAAKDAFMHTDEIEDKLRMLPGLQNCTEDTLCAELAELLRPELDKKYACALAECYRSTMVASMQNKRKSHTELQEKCNTLISTIRLCEKGLTVLCAEETKKGLEKHLLKTMCHELMTAVFIYALEENGKDRPDKELSFEQKQKLLAELPKDVGEPLLKLLRSLSGASASAFLSAAESALPAAVDVCVRKPDKKRDRAFLFAHRQALTEQLGAATDPALTLHLATLLTFQLLTSHMLHASGKFVPQLLAFLAESAGDKITGEQIATLAAFERLVVRSLAAPEDEEVRAEIRGQLEKLTPAVKDVPAAMKKAPIE